MAQSAVVEQLREKIRKLEAQPRELVLALRTGHEALDAFGAFRLGTGVELCGEEASGRTTVALSLVAAAGRERRLSAWVDGPRELYPPAAVPLGVDLRRLLLVRPREPGQLVWAAMQLLRSGAFTLVVLDVTHTNLRLTMTDTKKLLDAARTGGALLTLVTSATAPAQGFVRLMMKTRPAEPRPGLRLLDAAREGPNLPTSPPPGAVTLPTSSPPGAVTLPTSSPPGAVTLPTSSPPGALITPTFALEAPHGRRAEVPARPLLGRRLAHTWAPPAWHEVAPRDSLQRPKKNLLRDGYPSWGTYRTNPMPPQPREREPRWFGNRRP